MVEVLIPAIVALDFESGLNSRAGSKVICLTEQNFVAKESVLPVVIQMVLAQYDPVIDLDEFSHHALPSLLPSHMAMSPTSSADGLANVHNILAFGTSYLFSTDAEVEAAVAAVSCC